ncbi:hypothetical protein PG993_004078 [Apiospora rasikravindrae]|uniref:Uncharacterized protein n=1 Tax=Apiospora rasikravindrae TaxID=990691 RepID=A0ABR1TBR2_9PEZI
MAKSAVSARNHILRALGKWPQDVIRPQVQFQDVLRKRLESKSTSGLSEQEELKQANALYSLLDNRYKKKYPITGTLLQPKSNPTYFTDLVKELQEAPNRSWLDRFILRIKGVVRLK